MRFLILNLAIAALVTACASAPDSDMPRLAGTSWRLVSVNGKPALPSYVITLAFTADEVSGHTGINRFHGPWTWSDDAFHCGPFAMTRAAGPPKAMDQERAFLRALEQTARVGINGNQMVLGRADGDVLVLSRQ